MRPSHLGFVLLSIVTLLVAGCLTWSPPGGDGAADDDDTAVGDDDDAADDDDTAVDDDDTVDDDDDTADDDDSQPPVGAPDALAEGGAIVAITEVSEGYQFVAGAAFSTEEQAPSMEEAIIEELLGISFPLQPEPNPHSHEFDDDHYTGSSLVAVPELPSLNSQGDSLELPGAGRAYGRLQQGGVLSGRLLTGGSWRLGLAPDGPFGGSYEAFGLPDPLALAAPRRDPWTIYMDAVSGLQLSVVAAAATQHEAVLIGAEGLPDGGGATFIAETDGSGLFELPASSLPVAVAQAAEPWVGWLRINRRVFETDDGRLLLSSARIERASLRFLGTTEYFVGAEPAVLAHGVSVLFELEAESGVWSATELPEVRVGGVEATSVTYLSPTQLRVEADTSGLDLDRHDVAVLGGGVVGVGQVRVGFPVPVVSPCELEELESNNTTVAAEPLVIGQVGCGVLDPGADRDLYAFQATAGVTYRFQTLADQIGTGTDTILRVLGATGQVLAENDDDGNSLDSALDWVAPLSGPAFVEVVHYADGGGPHRAYRLHSGVLD